MKTQTIFNQTSISDFLELLKSKQVLPTKQINKVQGGNDAVSLTTAPTTNNNPVQLELGTVDLV